MKKLLSILLFSITTFVYSNQVFVTNTSNASQERSIKNLKAVPNPFTSITKITFVAFKNKNAILTVKNLLGKTVYKIEFKMKIGDNQITFYKNKLDSGMYIYSIQTESEIISKRLVIK